MSHLAHISAHSATDRHGKVSATKNDEKPQDSAYKETNGEDEAPEE